MATDNISNKFKNCGEYIYCKCREWGNRPFVKELVSSRSYSYSCFWSDIEKVAGFFDKLNFKRGDKIVLQIDNGVSSLNMLMGAIVYGVVPIIVNPQAEMSEIEGICSRVDALAIFKNIDQPGRTLSKIPILDIRAYHRSKLKRSSFSNEIRTQDAAYIMFTSGSTAEPKEISISHKNMLAEIESMAKAYNLGKSDKHLCVLPIFHASALYRNIFMPFHTGSETVLADRFDEDRFWNIISGEKINFVQTVPSILSALLMKPENFRKCQQSSLKYIGSASAPHPVSLVRSFEEHFGVSILEGYGMTEATCGITLNPIERSRRRVGSVGLPLSVNKIEIWNERQERMARGESGHVMVSGANISASCFSAEGGNGKWLDTGDIGYLDRDGFLWLLGRNSDFIKRGAYRISPNEIENAISGLYPDTEVAVAGVPHSLLGEDVVAFISGDKGLTSREVISKIKNKISSYKIPSEVLFVDDIPKLGVGKVDRKRLAGLYSGLKSKKQYIGR